MKRELKNEFSWSKSRHETFHECHRKYYFHYYGAWGGWDLNADPRMRQIYVLKNLETRQMWMGGHVHRCVEEILKDLKEGRELPAPEAAIEKMLQRMRDDFKASRAGRYRENPKKICGLFEHEYGIQVPPEVWKETADKAALCVRNFYGSAVLEKIRRLPPSAWLEVEERQTFELDGLKVYVQLDFAFRDNERILIYDWKTGRTDAERNDLQLACYILYASGKWSCVPEQITATAVYLADGTEVPEAMDAARLEEVKELIRESADEMLFPLADPQNNVPDEEDAFGFADDERTCKRCNFVKVCPKFAQD